MRIYQVGGSVRDEFLGVPSKDIDFSCVLEQVDIDAYSAHDKFTPFEYTVFYLKSLGFKVFLQAPDFLTVRARFPKGHEHAGLVADFVLARKELGYSDGRRPDSVIPGTLEDDLARRDFTMNAIAKDEAGNLIDPYNGRRSLNMGLIDTVGDPLERFTEDALRAVRALRFSVTKNMQILPRVKHAMGIVSVLDAVHENISDERIYEELRKMFAFNTISSIAALNEYPQLTNAMFAGKVNLTATMKEIKHGR